MEKINKEVNGSPMVVAIKTISMMPDGIGKEIAAMRMSENLEVEYTKEPWVKWFLKTKVQAWLMATVDLKVENYWKHWCRPDTEIFIIWVGTRFQMSDPFYHNYHHKEIEFTLVNFRFKFSIFLLR